MHKPPLLLLHEDIESVEFCRQGGGGGASTKTFDLAIRDRNEQARPHLGSSNMRFFETYRDDKVIESHHLIGSTQ